MSEEIFLMSPKDRKRLLVMESVKEKSISLAEAAEQLAVSYRHVRRIWQRYSKFGPHGLTHRSRGRKSNRALEPELKQRAFDLYAERLCDYGPTLAAEVMEDEHGLTVNAETLRRWLHEKHLLAHKTRHRVHRRRRARRKHFGSMVQMDGSDHDWFEDRAGRCCLMVAVDDATGRTLTHMSKEETLHDAHTLLGKWIERYGIPAALYVDRKNVYAGGSNYFKSKKTPGNEKQGNFIRACEELGIRLIFAHSPQAKGRVERKNGVLQDRLVKEMRRKGIDSIEAANEMLDEFTDRLDAKHAVAPEKAIDRHRRRPSADALNRILCREDSRKVQSDWTVSYKGKTLQIDPQANGPRPRDRVIVRLCLDEQMEIIHRGHQLKWRWFPKVHETTQSVPPPPGAGELTGSVKPLLKGMPGML